MRISLAFLLIGLTTSPNLTLTNVRAQPAFSAGLAIQSVNDFYEPLSVYGTWVDVAPYGRCWYPANLPAGWRPYSNGSWEWTNVGWYWASDEPWAWACYHYGYWVYDATYGWIWVPGTEWAPSWVAWRESPDFIGWAPCPLESFVVAPSLFVFVDIHRFHHPIRPDILIINNPTIIERTRLVKNLKREVRRFDGIDQAVVIDPGPALDPIQRATGTKFMPRPIGEVVAQTPVPTTIRRSSPGAPGREMPPTPTGREQPRVSPMPPQPMPQPGTLPRQVAPSQPAPQSPRETPLPPTGREPAMNPGNPKPGR